MPDILSKGGPKSIDFARRAIAQAQSQAWPHIIVAGLVFILSLAYHWLMVGLSDVLGALLTVGGLLVLTKRLAPTTYVWQRGQTLPKDPRERAELVEREAEGYRGPNRQGGNGPATRES